MACCVLQQLATQCNQSNAWALAHARCRLSQCHCRANGFCLHAYLSLSLSLFLFGALCYVQQVCFKLCAFCPHPSPWSQPCSHGTQEAQPQEEACFLHCWGTGSSWGAVFVAICICLCLCVSMLTCVLMFVCLHFCLFVCVCKCVIGWLPLCISHCIVSCLCCCWFVELFLCNCMWLCLCAYTFWTFALVHQCCFGLLLLCIVCCLCYACVAGHPKAWWGTGWPHWGAFPGP